MLGRSGFCCGLALGRGLAFGGGLLLGRLALQGPRAFAFGLLLAALLFALALLLPFPFALEGDVRWRRCSWRQRIKMNPYLRHFACVEKKEELFS